MPPTGLLNKTSNTPVPLTGFEVDVVICTFTAEVVIQQHYHNSETVPIEAVFKFPLDELSALYFFEAYIDGRTLVAEIQEKEQAQQTYSDAISSGKGSYLLEKEADNMFTMNVGNLPPNKTVVLKVGYVTELLAYNNAFRFELPAAISPTLLQKGTDNNSSSGGDPIKINGTITMATPIISVISNIPNKLIVNNMKGNTAVFSTRQLILDQNFVLDVLVESVHALPRIQREVLPAASVGSKQGKEPPSPLALGLYFWPNDVNYFESDTEVLFLVDRSGSMGNGAIDYAKATMFQVLKHLPAVSAFNIISFGSSYSSLFPQPKPSNYKSVHEARKHIASMTANMGGTDLLDVFKYIFQQIPPTSKKYKIPDRLIFLLTDGEVANTPTVIDLVKQNSKYARVYTFGIGNAVSRSLIDGVAQAANGKAVYIKSSVEMETLVIQQINSALEPAYSDVSVKWYTAAGAVMSSADVTQAPLKLPPIFNNQLYTVYALARARDFQFSCVRLEATGKAGTISFEITPDPQQPPTEGFLLHRLAARTLIREIEEENVTTNDHKKQEIICLATTYNLASKHTSFVIVENRMGESTQEAMQLREIPSVESSTHKLSTRKSNFQNVSAKRIGVDFDGATALASSAIRGLCSRKSSMLQSIDHVVQRGERIDMLVTQNATHTFKMRRKKGWSTTKKNRIVLVLMLLALLVVLYYICSWLF